MVVIRIVSAGAVLLTAACGFSVVAVGQTFADEQPRAAAVPSVQQPPSLWSRIPKPEVTWPKIEMPKLTMPTIAWPEFDPEGAASSALAPLKASAQKVTSGAKRAWQGTKEILSFGGGSKSQPTARTAGREQPSVWRRMFGSSRPDPGPQTVDEFMRGTRLQ